MYVHVMALMANYTLKIRSCIRSCFCDCSCARWTCWQNWRLVCKPLMVIVYLIILLVFLPLLIYELYNEHAEDRFKAWFVAGIFMLLTFPIFLLGLTQHLLNYTQPHLQKHIIRILWMVPIYSLDSWLGLKYPKTAIYWDTVRECYEAYVLYNFLCYLLNFLKFEYDLPSELMSRPPVTQPIPFCCCPPWPKGMDFIKRCKLGVLQYVVVRIALTVVAFITEMCHKYDKGQLKLNRAYVYLAVMNGISQIIALHSLIYFYKGTRKLLKPLNPVWKFLSIKAIVFFMFWQALLIAILAKTGVLKAWEKYDDQEVAEGLQNFVICIEMLAFAIAHYFVFSHKPYIDPAAAQVPCIASCLRMLDVRDVAGDMKEHFVDPIPRPSLPRLVSKTKISRSSEAAPLLVSDNDGHQDYESDGQTTMAAGFNETSLSLTVLKYEGLVNEGSTVARRTTSTGTTDSSNSGTSTPHSDHSSPDGRPTTSTSETDDTTVRPRTVS